MTLAFEISLFPIVAFLAAAAALSVAWFCMRPDPSVRLSNLSPMGEIPLPGADDAAGAVAMLDVDDLSSLNVATGYDTGDRLLGTMEDVLRRALPEGLGFEKLESGRFVIWLPSPDLDQAASLVENLRKLAASSFVEVSSGPMSRPVSAGLAPTFAEAGRNRALVHVSSAVARAKALGGNRLEMDRGQPEAPALIGRAQIEAAVESGALDYYVQPIVDLSTDHVAGVEALLRWRQDDGDVVGPADFIHRLERLPDVSEEIGRAHV